MKKTISAVLPFLCMFILATGSVILSCATAPTAVAADRDASISVNTGPLQSGKLYTVWVFDRMESVMIVDESDRSRKIELAKNEWRYDPETTELSVLREIPFKDYLAHIEGPPSRPHAFVLNAIKDETDLLVIFSDRLAIEGYDYTFDAKESRLAFRNDVDLKETAWSIQYSTPYGGAMLGDWKANPAQPPELILRAATPQEFADMKSTPLNVVKFRTETKDRALAREIGFDARVPRSLSTESPRREYPLAWKTIEEFSKDGNLVRKLDIVYEDGSGEGLGQYVIKITMEKVAKDESDPKETEWLIDEETVDLGLPVRVIRQWGTESSDLDSKPAVVRLSTWTWTEGSIRCQAHAGSENDARTAALLRQFIAARMKGD